MVFSSLLFCFAFLPANLICYSFCKTVKSRNVVLLAFSLFFYAFGEPVYVAILVLMSLFCWLFSRLIDTAKNSQERKLWLAAAVAVCLGSIGYFKYAGFAVESLNSLIGTELIAVPHIQLPIGISFYTFQLLTYVIDVYRGEVPSQKHFYNVLLYASLFHQCIAGPIVRYDDVANELTERSIDINDVSKGLTRFACGLGKKAILANGCGAVADTLLLSDAAIGSTADFAANLALIESRSALSLWVGMAFFMLQIYLDFSAYSDMAIGMGLMIGFHYKENFDYPYISASVTEFWRRWHMSLGTFFRDYVYIPLGGNRKGKLRQVFNLFVVWALTGLWHGAAWNFVLWGLYFFVFLVIERLFLAKLLEKLPSVFSRIYLLMVVFFGWVIFKFPSPPMCFTVLKGMFGLNGNSFTSFEATAMLQNNIFFLIVAVIACTPLVRRMGEILSKNADNEIRFANIQGVLQIILPIILLLVSTLGLVGDSYNPFLYFQF